MAVTINDVAKKAGVSHTTVSWVIHNDPRITQKTKDKVRKAIEELDYHPNYNARSLVKGKTDAIAVVAGFFSSYFEMSILQGIESAMTDSYKGYNLNLYSTASREDEVLKEILYGRRADAVIVLSHAPSQKIIDAYNKNGIPLILVESFHQDLISVKSNNISGAEQATNYLIESGFNRVGIILEERHKDTEIGLSQMERMEGFKNAHQNHDKPINQDLLFGIDYFRMDRGRDIARNIVNKGIKVDAIFCAAGDYVAIGLMDEFKKLGLTIGEDIAIVGFDDIDIAPVVSPALTTVKQDLAGLGLTAYQLAVKAIEKESITDRLLTFDTKLVKRESC